MSNCEKFCNGPVNVIGGMKAQIIEDLELGRDVVRKGTVDCPLGFKHNPTSKVSTRNLVNNGGVHTICQANKWKFEQLPS